MNGSEIRLEVLNPTGVDLTKKRSLAARPDTLDYKRIGLVWNRKPACEVLLAEIGKLLKERYPTAEIHSLQVSDCCTKLPPGELEAIAKQIDVGVFAGAD